MLNSEFESESESEIETENPPNPPLPGGGQAGEPAAKPPKPPPARRLTERQAKLQKCAALTDAMRTIGAWFRRRGDTLWSCYEAEALAALGDPPPELAVMAAYYTAKIPRAEDFRRRDLGTLLNNWSGELDRARQFAARPARNVSNI